MMVKDVIILKEVSDDLNEGKAFYDQKEPGVGDYYWDSLLADIESLLLYSGHSQKRAWLLPNVSETVSLCHLLLHCG